MEPSSLVFPVRRQEPELVVPINPTPRELKQLSVLDDRELIRIHIPILMMYRNNTLKKGHDPVKVIRKAIAQTLVHYYPLAGRLREGPARKLHVDCTGEGVMFIEADADITLDDFGAMLHPPFPCVKELLFDVPGSAGIVNCPLLLIQVTRLNCGGFIFGLRLNHVMSDASGIVQFMSAVGEMARAAMSPSTLPCWNRDFFCARDPPLVTHTYVDGDVIFKPVNEAMVEKTFFFGPSQVSALRNLAPHTQHWSTFDLFTACLWRCRTVALQLDPKDDVYMLFALNARRLKFDPPMPRGYYGNAAIQVVASTAAGNLYDVASFGFALELIRKAKADVSEEHVRSMVDLIAMKGFVPVPGLARGRCFVVTDLRLIKGFADVDFGWGRAVHGGVAGDSTAAAATRGLSTSYMACNNQQGEEGMLVRMAFPSAAMKIFESELGSMLNYKSEKSNFNIMSSL